MYSLILFLLTAVPPYSYSKPTLLTFVVPYTYPYNGSQDVVAIDPVTGNITKLGYHLPTANKLCARINQQKGLIYVLYGTNSLTMYSLKDGHEVDSYNISYSITATYFTSWNYDADRKLLYGSCLKPDKVAINWNYTWCYVHFNEKGTGELKYENFIAVADDALGCGYCSNILMNQDTFTSRQYWYALDHSVTVKNISSWDTLWSVEDNVGFDAMIFAALITGKANEYAIIIHIASKPFVVAKLTPDGQETILAKLPDALSSQAIGAVPWAHDPESQILYIMLQSSDPTVNMLVDTLVKVDLTQPPAKAVQTVKLPLDSLGYDATKYTVFETHLIM